MGAAIDTVCHLAKLGPISHTDDEIQSAYLETLKLVAKYDKTVAGIFDMDSKFFGHCTSKEFKNEVIKIIHDEVIGAVKKEMHDANFVNILLDKNVDLESHSCAQVGI